MDLSRVLFVDDDVESSQALIRSLKRQEVDFECTHVTTASEALSFVKDNHPEVAVVDLSLNPTLGPESGLTLLEQLLELDPTLRVLVLTGHGSDEYALKALQRGAASFLRKPTEVIYLYALLNDAVSFARLKRQFRELSSAPEQLERLTGLTARSASMKKVLEQVAYAAGNNQPVLLVGETGTGKGVIAQAIHNASERRGRPFIRFQPSFAGADIVSSELFGHVKGAFTGATENRVGLIQEAHRGTLFLDEVDELPVQTQVTLLEVIQERRFRQLGSNKEHSSDFRLLAATNQPLAAILEQKKLREDFYHRIAHFKIEIPPLRERLEDIELLVEHAIRELTNRENLQVYAVSDKALARLRSYSWPGNVRELLAKIEGAVYSASFHGRRVVEPEDLELLNSSTSKEKSLFGNSFREKVHNFELELVKEALERAENNQTRAAESLQLDRSTLRRILER